MTQLLMRLGQKRLFGSRRTRKMKLKFGVNQAAALLRGVDCRKSVVTLEVDRDQLTDWQLKLVNDRLLGNDVCECVVRADGSRGPAFTWDRDTYEDPWNNAEPCRLVADLPDLDSLMEAIERDELRIQEQLQLRQGALAA